MNWYGLSISDITNLLTQADETMISVAGVLSYCVFSWYFIIGIAIGFSCNILFPDKSDILYIPAKYNNNVFRDAAPLYEVKKISIHKLTKN